MSLEMRVPGEEGTRVMQHVAMFEIHGRSHVQAGGLQDEECLASIALFKGANNRNSGSLTPKIYADLLLNP